MSERPGIFRLKGGEGDGCRGYRGSAFRWLTGRREYSSLREETNVPSGRNECLLAKRRTSPREGTKTIEEREMPTSHPQMRTTLRTKSGKQAVCAATSALSRKAQSEDRKAPPERKRGSSPPCHKGIGRHCAEDGKGPTGVGFCSEDLARSKKSGTFVPSS